MKEGRERGRERERMEGGGEEREAGRKHKQAQLSMYLYELQRVSHVQGVL